MRKLTAVTGVCVSPMSRTFRFTCHAHAHQQHIVINILAQFVYTLEMWANAQRGGRPAEYRWRSLFNAAKFGWRPLLQCLAVTLPICETRWNVLGCSKLVNQSQSLVVFAILWGHVEEILLFNNFFPIVDMAQIRRGKKKDRTNYMAKI